MAQIIVLAFWLFQAHVTVEDLNRATEIRARAHELPDLDPRLVDVAVDAALGAETRTIRAELLLSIAWSESRFDPSVKTGIVCGALQVNPTDIGEPRSRCAAWARDTRLGFAAGVAELEMMLADHRVHGNLRTALLYRACGNAAFDGTCKKLNWPSWVISRARAIYTAPSSRRARQSS